jgi:hypothetical protein
MMKVNVSYILFRTMELAGSCELGKEHSDFIKGREFID